jgi:hypothetical protein
MSRLTFYRMKWAMASMPAMFVLAMLALVPSASAAELAAGSVKKVTFDDIKFPMEKTDTFKRDMLTPEIVGLAGKPIRIRGYILPSFQQSGITEFVLVRDNLECCFGPGAALYDCVHVVMKTGKSANYTTRPVTVTGTFEITEFLDPIDGSTLAIYHLDGDAVE